MDEIKIGVPEKFTPGMPHTSAFERNQALIEACKQLKPGEALPVEFPTREAAFKFARAAAAPGSLRTAGLRAYQRGQTVYLQRNGTH